MKNLSKPTSVVAKIVEICHWTGVIAMLVCLILSFVTADKIQDGFQSLEESAAESSHIAEDKELKELEIYDFQLNVYAEDGEFSLAALRIVFIAGMIVLSLWAMVFRNAHLIAKNTMNPELSYFCPDNLRMVREIGIFAIASPIVSLIFSFIARLILGVGVVITVSLTGLIVGLLVLFLTQFFVRGAELENEVEGLV